MQNGERDELDRMLDRGLASYGAREPRPGIEGRVMARVDAAARGRRRWIWLVPVMAGLVVVGVMLRWGRPDAVRERRDVESRAEVRAPEQRVTGEDRSVRAAARKQPAIAGRKEYARVGARHPRRQALPKREEFPSPAPVTGPERALLAFVRAEPEQARTLLTTGWTLEPLAVQELAVRPLQ